MGQTIEVQIRPESKPTLKTSESLSFGTRRKECAANHTNLDINNKVILTSNFPINLNDMTGIYYSLVVPYCEVKISISLRML
jgi:hypothetical protein